MYQATCFESTKDYDNVSDIYLFVNAPAMDSIFEQQPIPS
jgi:hypothetical protein